MQKLKQGHNVVYAAGETIYFFFCFFALLYLFYFRVASLPPPARYGVTSKVFKYISTAQLNLVDPHTGHKEDGAHADDSAQRGDVRTVSLFLQSN